MTSPTPLKYDTIVIGSGGGLKLALSSARNGRRTALIEAREMGGTCLNRGCIPSKMLIYPADLMRIMNRAGAINLRLESPPQVDFPALIGRIRACVEAMSAKLERQVQETAGLDLYRTPAHFVADHVLELDGRRLTAPLICIATGSRPALPDLPGLDRIPYLTSEQALRQPTLPRRLIVIGAGYIACELGHAYGTYGSETHFVVRSAMLKREDAEIQQRFQSAFARHHRLHTDQNPVSVRPGPGGKGLILTLRRGCDGRESELAADALLVASGVTPETDRLGLEHTGIALRQDGFIKVDDRLQTTVPGIYAMGDCIGRFLFRHAVNFESAYLAAQWFAAHSEPIRYPPMPGAVFSDPEVASVGLTEAEAQRQGLDYHVGRAEMADSNMGLARQLPGGMVKLLVERGTNRLIGAHIIGEDAATLLHIPLAVMSLAGTLEDLLKMIYIHPAFPEVIRDAARDAESSA